MKKQNLFLPLMAATAMLFASCNNNENVPNDNGGEAAKVRITIVSSSTVRGTSGTDDGIPAESTINKIEAYTFTMGGALIGYMPADGTSVEVKAQTGPIKIAVVANSNIGEVSTLDALKLKLSTHAFSKTNSTAIPSTGFVMSALDENANVATTQGVTKNITVKRTVSKFIEPNFTDAELVLSDVDPAVIDDELFPGYEATGSPSEITFAYTSFALANGLDKTLLLNDATYASSELPLTPWPARGTWIPTVLNYLTSTFDGTGAYTANSVYSGGFANVPVYVHENFPYADYELNGFTGYNPLEVYCFIVKGTLAWKAGTPVTRYWRINLVKSTDVSPTNDFYRVFRNGLYKVFVDQIKTIGYATPEEAEKGDPILPAEAVITITVDVAPWDVYVSTTQM